MKKTIHYCWFGKNKKSKLIKKCIDSWKKYCPNYEIKEWNEDNFDINCCQYVKEAYENKKWAFVSDYCRFFILYNYGGIYLDTDVEIIKPIDDLPDTFAGFENDRIIASGLIRGANPGDEVCKKMLESYQNDKFILDDGTQNLVTVCERETSLLVSLGLKLDGAMQTLSDGSVMFPVEYFCPFSTKTRTLNVTDKTYSIHHYAGSWLTKKQKFKLFVRKIIGNRLYLYLYRKKHQQ